MTTAPPVSPETAREAERGRRRRLAVIGAVVVVVLFAAALVIGQSSKSSPKPPGQPVGSQVDDTIPASIANLPLIDENGQRTSLAAFEGKIVVVNPFMTLCQEICPITTAELNQVDEAVTKAGLQDKVAFLNITIDPGRDTPQRLHAYRDFARLLPNWSLLTASPENLKTLWSYFGVGYQEVSEDAHDAGTDWLTGKPLTYDVNHSDVTTFLDPQGNRRYILQGMPLGGNAPLTSGERAFLNDEGRANLADTASASWDSEDAVQVVSWLADKHIKPVG